MFFLLSRSLLRSYCILALLAADLATSMPTPPARSTPEGFSSTVKSGFSNVPRVLEIQLPLKIATKEDLVAWAKYVMGLMASRINITLTALKDPPPMDSERIKTAPKNQNPLSPPKQKPVSAFAGIRTNGVGPNFNGQTIPNFASPIVQQATPTAFGGLQTFNEPGLRVKDAEFKLFDFPAPLKTRDDQQYFLPQYPNLGARPPIELDEDEVLRNTNVITPPSGMYLPLPAQVLENLKFPSDAFATRYYFDGLERNITSNLGVQPSLAIPLVNGSEIPSPMKINDLLSRRNLTTAIKPILTLPFEAVITIVREENGEPTSSRNEQDNYFVLTSRDPPDEFPPYFEKNYTLTNESGQINVVFDEGDQVAKNETTAGEVDEKKKDASKKQRSKKTKSRKRQSANIGELLKRLGILRKNNTAEFTLIPPPPPQQAKPPKSTRAPNDRFTAENKPSLSDRGRRNQTSQAQEIENDDNVDVVSDEDDGNKSSEANTDDDDYDDDDEDEGGGGSIQALIELLPLAAPILEDLSDPETETDIGELLQAAIPLLEGLSEGDDENDPPDIPGLLVPILMAISGGADGQGDSAAILGPVIQLVAPLIGPIAGPLIGPLSRQSSNPPGEGGSSANAIVQALIGPLSQPTGPGKMSPISTVVAGVVSSLSKEIASGKSGIDISALVKMVVSGLIAGTSAGLSGGHKDSAYAPTSYGGQGGYGGYDNTHVPAHSVNPITLIGTSIKDILNAGLKVASSLIGAVTGILGASSKEQPYPYGPPAYGAPANSYAPSPSAPFTRSTRPPNRQTRN